MYHLECFPSSWKHSFITPIFKSGSKNDVKNYRPISILITIPKVFENMVLDLLKPEFEQIIIKQQHGFTPGRSTLTNLLLKINKLK